jgi:hypothetical protein
LAFEGIHSQRPTGNPLGCWGVHPQWLRGFTWLLRGKPLTEVSLVRWGIHPQPPRETLLAVEGYTQRPRGFLLAVKRTLRGWEEASWLLGSPTPKPSGFCGINTQPLLGISFFGGQTPKPSEWVWGIHSQMLGKTRGFGVWESVGQAP